MASGITNALNSRFRLSGLSSGLDVDSMVQQLMRVEQAKVDKVRQDRTLIEWKRDDYRSIINSIRAFRDEYFDMLKPATNMRSITSLSAYKTTYNGLDSSNYLTATAGSNAISGSYTISNIELATAARVTPTASITDNVAGGSVSINNTSISALKDNNKLSVTFNGVTKEITISDGLSDLNAVKDDLNTKLEAAFGAGKITAGVDVDKLTFNTASTNVLSIGYAYNTGYSKILGTSISSPLTLDNQSNKFNIALNGGTAYTITVDATTYADADALKDKVQEKIDAVPELAGKVRVLNQNNQLTLKAIGSTGSATGALAGIVLSDPVAVDSGNSSLDVTIDGVTHGITLEQKTYTQNELLAAVQLKLNSAFGANKAMVSMDAEGKLRFEGISSTSTIAATRTENGGLGAIGFQDANKSNKLNLNAKLSDIKNFFKTDLAPVDSTTDDNTYDIEFMINDVKFGFNSSQTMNEIISTVNGNSAAGVTMSYDQLNDKIIVQSKATGKVSRVQISDVAGDGNLMEALGLAGADETGTDAAMIFNDGSGPQTIARASNDFTINGISFSLKSNTAGPIELKMTGDPTKTLELIKGFVNKYNELIDKINSELVEEKYRDFPPLTDEQRKGMNETDVKVWEEKAKSGLLRNDGIIRGFADKMRAALYKGVTGVSKSLYSIGITTGSWEQKGKLVIDEAKLKDAITNSPDEVMNLFSKQSSVPYSPDMSAEDRATRDDENGIANKLYDIFEDYIRTTRNSDGQKGILMEKAGITGDITEFSNLMSKEIQSKDLMISSLLDKLTDKENRYYKQFTAMERALSQMNSQSSWLAQQAGGGS